MTPAEMREELEVLERALAKGFDCWNWTLEQHTRERIRWLKEELKKAREFGQDKP